MTTSYAVKGTVLQITTTGSTTVFANIGQIISTDGPGAKIGVRDTTNLDSTGGENEATIGRPEPYKVRVLFNRQDAGISICQARTVTPSTYPGGDIFKIIFPTTTIFIQHPGNVTGYKYVGGDVETGWMVDLEITPSRVNITHPTTT